MPKRRVTTYLGDCSFERLRALADEDRRSLSDYVAGVLGGILNRCVNSQAVYPLSEQHGLKARERRYTAHEEGKHWE